jgi:hypothetical protein
MVLMVVIVVIGGIHIVIKIIIVVPHIFVVIISVSVSVNVIASLSSSLSAPPILYMFFISYMWMISYRSDTCITCIIEIVLTVFTITMTVAISSPDEDILDINPLAKSKGRKRRGDLGDFHLNIPHNG